MSGRPWTAEEDAVIRLHAGNLLDRQIAVLVGRTTAAVKERRPQIVPATPKAPTWSDAEVAILRERYTSTPVAEMASLLPGRTPMAIMAKVKTIGVRQRKPLTSSGRRWSEDEDKVVRVLYPDNAVASLVAHLPARSAKAIERRAFELGLTHSEKFWAHHYSTKVSLGCYPPELQEVIRLGRKLKKAINDHESQHP